jgi:hypothetical protein
MLVIGTQLKHSMLYQGEDNPRKKINILIELIIYM